MSTPTFIIDCPHCKAKVAANEKGRAERCGSDPDSGEPYGYRLYVGSCPSCTSLLVGESTQIGFEDYESSEEVWSDIVRVHPKPARTFRSHRIPRIVTESLADADRSLQANANIAAVAMFGRTLEAVCRDILDRSPTEDCFAPPAPPVPPATKPEKPKKKIMLAEGIRKLKDKDIIDARLYDWSQQLHAFRNLAAHADEISIPREDAEDLQTFVYAIIEYIYDLTERYHEFKSRNVKRAKRKEPDHFPEI